MIRFVDQNMNLMNILKAYFIYTILMAVLDFILFIYAINGTITGLASYPVMTLKDVVNFATIVIILGT